VNPLQDQRYNKVSLDESENREKVKVSFFSYLYYLLREQRREQDKKRERKRYSFTIKYRK
jgi:hypothetical protein